MKPYTPHPPHPKQRAFLELDAQEALYGGAAGSGKSDALLMAALQYVDRPTYSALLLRRREVDLYKNQAILDRAKTWFAGTAAKWDGGLTGFRFPSYDSNPGATISFGHLTREADRGSWKGPDFQFIGVEELTEWDEGDYIFLFSRLRSVDVKVPTRMRGNTNPGGDGHEWVYERFVHYAKQLDSGRSYEEWRTGGRDGSSVFESPPSAQVVAMARQLGVQPQGAHFVPAFAEDNPSVNRIEYLMNLAQLDPVEYAWYAEGDWNARPSGEIFERAWLANFLDEEPQDAHWVRYWDLAATDPNAPENKGKNKDPAFTAGVKVGLQFMPGGNARVIIADVVRGQKKTADRDAMIRAVAEADGKELRIAIELEPGSSGVSVVSGFALNTLLGWDVDGDRKTGSKEEMWRPLAGLARAGGVWLVRGPWNRDFVSELVNLPKGKKDQADAAAGAYAWLLKKHGRRAPLDIVLPLDDARESPWTS